MPFLYPFALKKACKFFKKLILANIILQSQAACAFILNSSESIYPNSILSKFDKSMLEPSLKIIFSPFLYIFIARLFLIYFLAYSVTYCLIVDPYSGCRNSTDNNLENLFPVIGMVSFSVHF
jgi:hypothetical protein